MNWWERHRRKATSETPFITDICPYCPHTRDRHGDGGCEAKSARQVGAPGPCDCTNRRTGSIYGDATKLA